MVPKEDRQDGAHLAGERVEAEELRLREGGVSSA
jgi:hypothetical protein